MEKLPSSIQVDLKCTHISLKERGSGRLSYREGKGNVMMEAETGMVQPRERDGSSPRSWKRQREDSLLEPSRNKQLC